VKLGRQLDDLLEPLVFPSERGPGLSIAHRLRVEQESLNLRGPDERVGETIAETQVVFFPYFWRNRSTRPAVSTSFCLPV